MRKSSSSKSAHVQVEVSDDMPAITPGVAARLLGVSPPQLRWLEAGGFVQPHRSPKGRRLYSRNDLNRLHVIATLSFGLGLNWPSVRAAMALLEEVRSVGLDPMDLLQRVTRRLATSSQ